MRDDRARYRISLLTEKETLETQEIRTRLQLERIQKRQDFVNKELTRLESAEKGN